MTGAKLDGYGIIRRVREDAELKSTHRALLVFAVARAVTAGKDAGKVRASLERLGKDAGLSSRTAERAFSEPAVLRYFARVERRTRSVGLWFNLTTPDSVSGVDVTGDTTTPDTLSTTPDSLSATPDTESGCLPVLPIPLQQASQPASEPKGNDAPSENRHPMAFDVARALACSPDEAHAAITKKLSKGDHKGDGGGLIRHILRTNPDELRDLIPTAADLADAVREAEQIAAKAAERQTMVETHGPRPADFDGGQLWDQVRTAQAMHTRHGTPVTEQGYRDAVTELRNHQANPTPPRTMPAGPWPAYDPDATLPPRPSGDLYGNFTPRDSASA